MNTNDYFNYFSMEEISEALTIIANAKSEHMHVELHNISPITDVPKSMHFSIDPKDNTVFVMFQNFIFPDDPFAECYEGISLEDLKNDIDGWADELFFRPFNEC